MDYCTLVYRDGVIVGGYACGPYAAVASAYAAFVGPGAPNTIDDGTTIRAGAYYTYSR